MSLGGRGRAALAAAGLLALVALVYVRTAGFQYLAFDDDRYVYANPVVLAGLRWQGIGWAFTSFWASNWHPLTWISHMADVSLFGPGPAGPHLVNAALHGANAVLLFLLMRGMTGSLGRSFLVAAIFAVHPLRAESVAWVAERKDVLSAFLALATLAAYHGYVHRGGAGRLALAAWIYVLSLLAKPMAVSLPLLMLLLDFWPLGRLEPFSWKRLARLLGEKIPFFFLATASCLVTLRAQGPSMADLRHLPLAARLANAAVAYVRYLGLALWPRHLVPFYPLRDTGPALALVFLALVILPAATALAWRQRRRKPYVLVGWGWFLIAFVPVIGIVQVGGQAMADRYTYLPLLGPTVILVWAGAELAERAAVPGRAQATLGVALVAVLLGASWVQVGYWRSTETLFGHALLVDGRNPVAWTALGLVRAERKDWAGAALFFRRAAEVDPDYYPAQVCLGDALYRTHDESAALRAFAKVLSRNPDEASALFRAADILRQQNRLEEAVTCYRQYFAGESRRLVLAADLQGERARSRKARRDFVSVLLKLGWTKEAARVLQAGLRLDPTDAVLRDELRSLDTGSGLGQRP